MEIQLGEDGNPIIDQFSEEDFVDLTLGITDLVDQETHLCFHLVASYEGSEVGFDVLVVKGIHGGFDKNTGLIKDQVHRQGVRFIRSGKESDRLVSAIADLYSADSIPRAMVTEETFTAIALHQGNLEFERECVKLKLFGRDGEPFVEDDYYESFFNIDFANRLVYWNEKDSDYREPLLRGLTAK